MTAPGMDASSTTIDDHFQKQRMRLWQNLGRGYNGKTREVCCICLSFPLSVHVLGPYTCLCLCLVSVSLSLCLCLSLCACSSVSSFSSRNARTFLFLSMVRRVYIFPELYFVSS